MADEQKCEKEEKEEDDGCGGVRAVGGLMRAGLLSAGLLNAGDRALELVVTCAVRPTRALMRRLVQHFQQQLTVRAVAAQAFL